MVGLTPAERATGREFRHAQQGLLAIRNKADAPRLSCSPWSPPFLRHECAGYRAGTLILPLRRQHIDSPEYLVGLSNWNGPASADPPGIFAVWEAGEYRPQYGPVSVVPGGRFRFTWLEGRCHRCGTTARSSSGYITILEEAHA